MPATASPKQLRLFLSLFVPGVLAQTGQPTWQGTGQGTFQIVGNSGVSAQQLFLGTKNKVYIIDKVENNPLRVNGHAAWGSEYDLNDNTVRAMDVVTNTFCAGGALLGDGTWINVGGNQDVTYGGLAVNNTSQDLYKDGDGRFAVRFLSPCDDGSCNWVDDKKNYMNTTRWYPTLETLEDGSVIIIGGNLYGGFVSSTDNNNPTYEYWPRRGDGVEITLNFLQTTLPANLYPLTWLLPSGNLFLTTNWATEIFDYKNNAEYTGPAVPHAVRTYPGSAANTMLPMTPANNWTATMVFCGGTDLQPNQWRKTVVVDVPASASCVRISPDVTNTFEEDDDLPDGRVMGNFILLPNGKVFLANGVNKGVAGYGNDSWAVGHSYADSPLLQPLMYDPDAPLGSRFSADGLSPSTVPRLYHSSATLLPDGSVFISGSNPNPDVTTTDKWSTEWRVERFYPAYYSEHRPEYSGLPEKLGYGGPYFNLTLASSELGTDPASSLGSTKVVLMRFGFSTHAINFGQKYVQLNNTYTINSDGTATLHVSQVPPNPAILAPGPAWFFVVVNGIPSMGQEVMVGSGKIEIQNFTQPASLPGVFAAQQQAGSSTGTSSTSNRASNFELQSITLFASIFVTSFAGAAALFL
ncbi:hypothetical protein FRC01_005494 [Tulasnella sp. 417]|nr:hypothetical protein FRC01_005494 [Tulasnella sp. 417]